MQDLKFFKKNLMFLIGATRGGPMRARIMHELIKKPLNPNMLSEMLGVDYKTITHHLDVLLKNNWVIRSNEKYAQIYKSTFTPKEREIFEDLWKELGKSFNTL